MKLMKSSLRRHAYNAFHSEWLGIVVAVLAVMLFSYGLYRLATFSVPMALPHYPLAKQSLAASNYSVFYAAALAEYDNKNYEACKKLASLAFDDLAPRVSQHEALAADILFLQGKALQRLNKKDPAISTYERALRLNPKHLACKYNLEMLQVPPPPQGGGGSGNDKNDQNQSGGNTKPDEGKPEKIRPKESQEPDSGAGKPKPKI